MARGFFEVQAKVQRFIRRQAQGANFSVPLPAYASLRRITLVNNTALAVTGGIRVGTSGGGTQVVTAQAVAGVINLPIEVVPTISALAQTAQTLFIEAVTAWNGANVDVVVEYEEVTPITNLSSAG